MSCEFILGDCLQEMDNFIKQGRTFDAIITSPPYNMCLRVHTGKYMSRWKWKECQSSFAAKYNNYTDDLPMEEYFKFQDTFIEKALQCSDLMFYNIQMVTGNKIALLSLLGKWSNKIKEIIIWDKEYGQPAMNAGCLNSQFEFIICFSNNTPYNRSFETAQFERGTVSNVWKIKREANSEHKASFPQELVKRILEGFTKKGDKILDPFMGSGTTGLVCKYMERDFTGIEIDKNYMDIAKRKIGSILI